MTEIPDEFARLQPPKLEPLPPESAGAPTAIVDLDAAASLSLDDFKGLRSAVLPPNATSDLAQLEIAERLRPEVEEVRRALFGASATPFPGDYRRGCVALLERIHALPQMPELDAVTTGQVQLDSERLRNQVDALGLRLQAGVEVPLLRLVSDEGQVTSHAVRAPRTHPLRQLADTVERLARRERISGARVLAHVLTGEPLGVPRAILSLRTPIGGGLSQLEVRFLVADATREDFIALQQLARDLVHGSDQRTRTTGLSEHDVQLLKVVRELGHDLAHRAPRGFWARAADRVAELTNGEDAPSAETLRFRANQLREKLQRLRATEATETE